MEPNDPVTPAGGPNPKGDEPAQPGTKPVPTSAPATKAVQSPRPAVRPAPAAALHKAGTPGVTNSPAATADAAQQQTGPAAPPQSKGATGPKYFKDNSSRNAVKEGWRAWKHVLLPHESAEEFQWLYEDLAQALAPQDTMEQSMVDEIIWAMWLSRRIHLAEGATMRLILEQDNAGYRQATSGSGQNSEPEEPQARHLMTFAANIVYDYSKDKTLALIRRYSGDITREVRKKLDHLFKYRETRQRLDAAKTQRSLALESGEVTVV